MNQKWLVLWNCGWVKVGYRYHHVNGSGFLLESTHTEPNFGCPTNYDWATYEGRMKDCCHREELLHSAAATTLPSTFLVETLDSSIKCSLSLPIAWLLETSSSPQLSVVGACVHSVVTSEFPSRSWRTTVSLRSSGSKAWWNNTATNSKIVVSLISTTDPVPF